MEWKSQKLAEADPWKNNVRFKGTTDVDLEKEQHGQNCNFYLEKNAWVWMKNVDISAVPATSPRVGGGLGKVILSDKTTKFTI